MALGYKVAFNFFHPPIDVFLGDMRSKKLSSSVWFLKVPHKVNIFVWKLLHEGIPTRMNLKKRFHLVDDICPICNTQ